MINKFKPISISLSPNVQKDDVVLAWKLLFQPWKWKRGSAIANFEQDFAKYLGVKYAVSFNSGRSAMYAILKALDLPKGSDVRIQAFTCNAVVNPILWAGLNPVYVDCGDDFNASGPVDIVQHTFGLPNQAAISDQVIEDCAHALGAALPADEAGNIGKKVGTIGKAGFFSFSRDKVISCVYGGMAVTNDDQIGQRLKQLQKEFGMPGMIWIKQQLLHPVLLNAIILPLYDFMSLGKVLLIFSQWLHVLSKAVSFKEKRGLRPDYFPKALPNALAILAHNQFKKLEMFNEHRKKIAEFYYQELAGTKFVLPKKEGNIFLRFAVQHKEATEILYNAWHKEHILLGDWYTTVIAPDDTNMKEMKYEAGMCPNAEYLAKRTLNLPTHINISMDDAKRIVVFLKPWR